MTALLAARHLVKCFNGLTAVNDISFEVQRGRCLGLLGPNGAGKTTTVEMLEGIRQPDEGQVLYKGNPLAAEFRQQAGIMFQSTALQDFITVEEALQMFARFYQGRADFEQLVEACALGEFLHRDASKLSGGQRQRLLLAIALVNDPEIIFLDEPTTGLDPQSRHNFWRLIDNIKAQQKTIVMSTHYMEEAYSICDDIIIMDHGQIIAEGSPQALLARYFNDVVIHLPPQTDLQGLGTELQLRHTEQGVEISTADLTQAVHQLVAANVSLQGMQIREPTLEDLFLQLTGEGLRQ